MSYPIGIDDWYEDTQVDGSEDEAFDRRECEECEAIEAEAEVGALGCMGASIWIAVWLALWSGWIYVAIHFIRKFW